MRPGKLRDDRKQNKIYISEQELKAELESQVAERKKQEILTKIMEQEELLGHYENYNMSKNNDEATEINDFISQKKTELESLKKNLDVSDNFKQQFEKQRVFQEPKKESSIPNFFSKYNEQQEKPIFENQNHPSMTTGELERQKRLRLREEERMRRLHGIASSAYDDQKSVLPIQIQQSIKIISDQENMNNQKKEKEFERIQKKEEILSSQPTQKVYYYDELNEKKDNHLVLPNANIPYGTSQNTNLKVFSSQEDVYQKEGKTSFYQERNRFNGNEESFYENSKKIRKDEQDNENQGFFKKDEYYGEYSKKAKDEKKEISKNQESFPEKFKEEQKFDGNKNVKNDRDEMKEKQKKYREELDEQIRLKKHQEQNQSQKNKLKRAQTTNDSRTTKDTRNYQNNQEGQINLDRSFQLKQEIKHQVSNPMSNPPLINPTSENLDYPTYNQADTKKNNKRIESADESKNYFRKIESENKQREDDKKKIQFEYQQELKRQIFEKEERMKREKEELERRDKEQLERDRMLEASIPLVKKGRKMVLKENQETDANYNSSKIPQANQEYQETQSKQFQSANQNENNEVASYKTTFKNELNNNANNNSKYEDKNYRTEGNQLNNKNNDINYISEKPNNQMKYEEQNRENNENMQNYYNQVETRNGNIQNNSDQNYYSNYNNNNNDYNGYNGYGQINNNNKYFYENQMINQTGYNTQMAYNQNINYGSAPQNINSIFKEFYEDFDQQTKLLKEAIEEKLRFEQITKEERLLLQEYKLKIKEILQQKAQYELEIEKIRHLFEKKYSNNIEANDLNLGFAPNLLHPGAGINQNLFLTNNMHNSLMPNLYMQPNMNLLQNLTSLSYLQSYLNPNNNLSLLSPMMISQHKSNLLLNNNRNTDNSYANVINAATNLNINNLNNQYEENIHMQNSNHKMDSNTINDNNLPDLNDTLPHQSEFVENVDKNTLEQSYLKDIEIFNEMQNNIYLTSIEDENQNAEKYAETFGKPNNFKEIKENDNAPNIDLKNKFKKKINDEEETPYDNEVFYTEEDFEDFEMKTEKTEKSIDHGNHNAITIKESLIIQDSKMNEENKNLENKEYINTSEIAKLGKKEKVISKENSDFSEENNQKENKSLFSYNNEKSQNRPFSRNRLKERMEEAKSIDSKLIKEQELINNQNITQENKQNNTNQIHFKSIQSIEVNKTKEKSKFMEASNANHSDEDENYNNDNNCESINEIQMNSAEIKNNEIFISEEEKSEIMENKSEKNDQEDYNKILSNSLFKSNYHFADAQENEKENIHDNQNNASLSLSFAEEIECAKRDLNIVKFKKPKIVDVFSMIEKKKQLAETSAIEDKKNMILKRMENFIKEIDSSNF